MLKPDLIQNLEHTSHFLFIPTNEEEVNQLIELLDEITDLVRDDETHPLANFMEVLGLLIETYENKHIPEPNSDPIGTLKHFMEEHDLNQRDLPELGHQGVVSEILSGKRDLNVRQIKLLSERFKVPASVFI